MKWQPVTLNLFPIFIFCFVDHGVAFRVCKFKLMGAEIAETAFESGGGQIIPTARRVIYSSFMLGNPKLMEPAMLVEDMCPPDCTNVIEDVVSHRRGGC